MHVGRSWHWESTVDADPVLTWELALVGEQVAIPGSVRSVCSVNMSCSAARSIC